MVIDLMFINFTIIHVTHMYVNGEQFFESCDNVGFKFVLSLKILNGVQNSDYIREELCQKLEVEGQLK